MNSDLFKLSDVHQMKLQKLRSLFCHTVKSAHMFKHSRVMDILA